MKHRGFDVARRVARRLGYDLLPSGFYSPVPHTEQLPPETWADPAPMPGAPLDLDAQAALVETELAPHLAELDLPLHGDGLRLANWSFGPVDASLLFALVRHRRPPRVVEAGSGISSLVIQHAARNAEIEHRVVDPRPSHLLDPIRDRIDLRATSAAAIQAADLRPGDLLFIDTTHVLKPGSEVLHLLLQVVPSLPPGVLVHVHDVFRPYEYPRALYDEFAVAWQEHYLVQALLVHNDRLDVLLANHALYRERPDVLRRHTPAFDQVPQAPSSLWCETTPP